MPFTEPHFDEPQLPNTRTPYSNKLTKVKTTPKCIAINSRIITLKLEKQKVCDNTKTPIYNSTKQKSNLFGSKQYSKSKIFNATVVADYR